MKLNLTMLENHKNDMRFAHIMFILKTLDIEVGSRVRIKGEYACEYPEDMIISDIRLTKDFKIDIGVTDLDNVERTDGFKIDEICAIPYSNKTKELNKDQSSVTSSLESLIKSNAWGDEFDHLSSARQMIIDLQSEIDRKNAVLKSIMDKANEMRSGTDDWFELVEFAAAARSGIEPK